MHRMGSQLASTAADALTIGRAIQRAPIARGTLVPACHYF
jgi:hypothetical protein